MHTFFFFYFEKRARRFFQQQQKHTKKYILKMLISFSWLKSSYLFSGLTTKENFNFLSYWWIQVDYSQYSFLFIRWHDFNAKIHNQAVFKWHFFSRSHSVLNKEWLGVYSKFLVTLIFFMSLLKTGLFFVSLRGFHWRVTSEGSVRHQSINLS